MMRLVVFSAMLSLGASLGWAQETAPQQQRPAIPAAGQAEWDKRVSAAQAGDAVQMYEVARRLERGDGVRENKTDAVQWYRRGAEAGHVESMFRLADMTEDGTGVAKDEREAAGWFRKAAEAGHMMATANYARMLLHGIGVTKNEREAANWHRKAAQAGINYSAYVLADLHVRGIGVAKDDAEAVRLLRQAAERGHFDAMNNLGWMLNRGQGTPRDPKEAAVWYTKAAQAGEPNAMYGLASILDDGRGGTVDRDLAARWVFASLQKGNRLARDQMRDNSGRWSAEFRQALQRRLVTAKVFSGPIDGVLGATSQSAIDRIFGSYKERGAPPDGLLPPAASPSVSAPTRGGGWLGVRIQSNELAGRKIVEIIGVNPLGPSQGQLPVGAKILTINDVRVETPEQFAELISRMRPGATVRLENVEDGLDKPRTQTVVVAERPERWPIPLTCPVNMPNPPASAMFSIYEPREDINPVSVAHDEIKVFTNCVIDALWLKELQGAYALSKQRNEPFSVHALAAIKTLVEAQPGPSALGSNGAVGPLSAFPSHSDSKEASGEIVALVDEPASMDKGYSTARRGGYEVCMKADLELDRQAQTDQYVSLHQLSERFAANGITNDLVVNGLLHCASGRYFSSSMRGNACFGYWCHGFHSLAAKHGWLPKFYVALALSEKGARLPKLVPNDRTPAHVYAFLKDRVGRLNAPTGVTSAGVLAGESAKFHGRNALAMWPLSSSFEESDPIVIPSDWPFRITSGVGYTVGFTEVYVDEVRLPERLSEFAGARPQNMRRNRIREGCFHGRESPSLCRLMGQIDSYQIKQSEAERAARKK